MDIFSLLSVDLDHQDDNSCYENWKDDDEDGSLFASPPSTPRRPNTATHLSPRTPPKSLNIDIRIRNRQHSPSSNHLKSISPSPSSSPSSLSTSPLQIRLERAKHRRNHQHSSRIQSISTSLNHKFAASELLVQESIHNRILQAHTNNTNAELAGNKRRHNELQSRLHLELHSHHKSKMAQLRKKTIYVPSHTRPTPPLLSKPRRNVVWYIIEYGPNTSYPHLSNGHHLRGVFNPPRWPRNRQEPWPKIRKNELPLDVRSFSTKNERRS